MPPDESPTTLTTPPSSVLDFYTRPGSMTSGGRRAALLDGLPREPAGLAEIVHGLMMHQYWTEAYGVTLTEERRGSSQIRPLEQMLGRLLQEDGRLLDQARSLDTRLIGVCRHFTVLLVGMLRAQGVPARARCGFASYFRAGHFEDHWVGEYWDAEQARWIMVDAQIDALQREKIRPDFDLLDVPRDRFVVAGDAWARYRAGEADPASFGFGMLRIGGPWFVAGNLLRDLAALNNREMLPWDVWGAMPGPDEPISDDLLELFDRVAGLIRDPDAHFDELRALYRDDERLRVPPTVRNVMLNCEDTV